MAIYNVIEKSISSHTNETKRMLLSCEVEPNEDELIVPEEVEIFHPDCFKGLRNIKKLIFPSGMNGISAWWDDDGFCREHFPRLSDLESLECIDLKNIKYISSGPFFDCKKLKVIKSSNPLRLEGYSLLHCFSLKEINCDKSEIESALGDTDLFDYPILHKELDVARMKTNFDFSKVLNQQDYVNSWDINFRNRNAKEIILFDKNRPYFAICDKIGSSKNLDEFIFVWSTLWEEILEMGGFNGEEWSFPIPDFYLDNHFEKLVKSVESKFNITCKDLKSPRKEIRSLEDALYFIRLENFFNETRDFANEANELEPGEEKVRKAKELVEMLKEYLVVMLNYYEGIHDKKNIIVINNCLDNSSNWLDYFLSPDRIYGFDYWSDEIFEELTGNTKIGFLECDIVSTATKFLFDKLANKHGYHSIDFEKYESLSLVGIDSYDAAYYYSIGFNGDVSYVYLTNSINGGHDSFWDDLCYISEATYRESTDSQDRAVYLNFLLRNDISALKTVEKYDINEHFFQKENYRCLLTKDNQNLTLQTEYSWHSCGFKRENVNYARVISDLKYVNELAKDGLWFYFPIVFDIENIILAHDFDSFKVVYNLTKNAKDEDCNNVISFSFVDTATLCDDPSKSISILDEEGFNTIVSVKDKPINNNSRY